MTTDSVNGGKTGARSRALEISTNNVHVTGVLNTDPATPNLTPAASSASQPGSPYQLVCRQWKSFGRRKLGRVKAMIGLGGVAVNTTVASRWRQIRRTSVGNMRRGKSTPDEMGEERMDENAARHSSDNNPQGAALSSVLLSGAHTLKAMNRPDKTNEDEFFQFNDLFRVTCVPQPDGLEKVGAFGVFDGHGGASCSSFVCRHLPLEIARSPIWTQLAVPIAVVGNPVGIDSPKQEPPLDTAAALNGGSDELLSDVMRGALLDGFRRTQEKFLEVANARGKDSGSTAVVALVCGGEVVIANLGDSEALFCDDCTLQETDKPFVARTQCHDVKNAAERKRVEAAGGTFSNGRLFGMLCPTRSFGDRDIIGIKEGVLTAVPEFYIYRIRPTAGAAFLVLGTDGLWGNVSDSKVVELVRADYRRKAKRNQAAKPSRTAEALVREAGKIFLGDDATAVVVLLT